jgi:HAD superfamily hydrolase (TIGR01490 family)
MKKFAAFDIDGTLIRWQLYHATVDELANAGLLGTDAKAKLRTARMHWKRREHPEAFRAYEKELISVYETALIDIPADAFDHAAQTVVNEYSSQVYTYTRDLIANLKQQGYCLLAISGSHVELVEHIAKLYGFDDWVGSIYERKGGQFTGEKYIANKDKGQVLSELIKKHDLSLQDSVAVGDSGSDAAMLDMVEQPIAFNPDKSLYKLARQNGWKIVVERKNVTYELEAKNGTYVLA